MSSPAPGDNSATQVVLAFDDNRLASLLFGQYGQNLALIERRLGVVAEQRGNHVTLAGSRDGVERARRVLVRAWTPDEQQVEIEAEELLAVALQHEIDHLDGKLFLDRLSRLKRDLYRARQRKLERHGRKSASGPRPLLI